MSKFKISEDIKFFLKETWYYAFKNDLNFPQSCGLVSLIMTYFLNYTNLRNIYDIYCTRGCFKNEKEEDENFCEDFIDVDRYSIDNLEIPCGNCNSCDFMVSHSWIELISKENNETIILDFTSIQFEDDFCDYQEKLLTKKFSKDELYEYIIKRSNIIITKEDNIFKNYIPLEIPIESHLVMETTKRFHKQNIKNDILDMIEYCNIQEKVFN